VGYMIKKRDDKNNTKTSISSKKIFLPKFYFQQPELFYILNKPVVL